MNEATALILQKRIEAFFDVDPAPDDKFAEMLAAMRADFPASAIGKLPRVTCGDCSSRDKQCQRHSKQKCTVCDQWISTAHIHLDFVGHAHLTDRLNTVDPSWDWLPAAFDDDGLPKVSGGGNLWIILRFGGRFYQGLGDAGSKKGGDALKEMIGDALRNVGMRRGAALSLWMKERDVADDESDGTGSPNPAKAATKAAAKKAPSSPAKAASKAPAKAPAKKAAAEPEGASMDDVNDLTAALAALEDEEPARTFIKGRGVDPDTWAGLTTAKARSIRGALKNMGTVQARGNQPLSKPPAPPKAPAAPEQLSPRAAAAQVADTLPEAWQQVLVTEIAAAAPEVNLAGLSVGETVMQAPAGKEWDDWLADWVADAARQLEEDATAVPPGGEPFEE